jgi:branched-chain amino acid transport system permease protein
MMVWLPDGLLSIPDRLKERRLAREASALRAAKAVMAAKMRAES